MKKLTKILATLLLVSAVIYSCKKKEDPAPPAASKTEMLINKNWVMTAGTVSPALIVEFPPFVPRTEITDLFAISNPLADAGSTCIKDDTLKLNALSVANTSGSYTRIVASDCNGEKDETGNWSFNADQTQIIFTTKSGSVTTNKILELTASKLKVESTLANPIDNKDTKLYTATITLSPK